MLFYGIWFVLLFIQCVHCDDSDEAIVTKCLNRKFDTKVELPIEIVNYNGELELWIHYNDKYDLYQTYNNGHIYNYELQLSEKITPRTGGNRANCSK